MKFPWTRPSATADQHTSHEARMQSQRDAVLEAVHERLIRLETRLCHLMTFLGAPTNSRTDTPPRVTAHRVKDPHP